MWVYVYLISLHPADGGSGISCDLHIQTQLVTSNNNDGVLRNHITSHIQMDLGGILKVARQSKQKFGYYVEKRN